MICVYRDRRASHHGWAERAVHVTTTETSWKTTEVAMATQIAGEASLSLGLRAILACPVTEAVARLVVGVVTMGACPAA